MIICTRRGGEFNILLSMDPPPDGRVGSALQFLADIGAAETKTSAAATAASSKRRKAKSSTVSTGPSSLHYYINPYGRLLADLPIDLDSRLLLISGAAAGLLPEALTLAVAAANTPLPIEVFVGQSNAHLRLYGSSQICTADKLALLMDNLSAVHFYKTELILPDLVRRYHQRSQRSKAARAGDDGPTGPAPSSTLATAAGELDVDLGLNEDMTDVDIYRPWELLSLAADQAHQKQHDQWCAHHFLNADALRTQLECEAAVMQVLRRYFALKPNPPSFVNMPFSLKILDVACIFSLPSLFI